MLGRQRDVDCVDKWMIICIWIAWTKREIQKYTDPIHEKISENIIHFLRRMHDSHKDGRMESIEMENNTNTDHWIIYFYVEQFTLIIRYLIQKKSN